MQFDRWTKKRGLLCREQKSEDPDAKLTWWNWSFMDHSRDLNTMYSINYNQGELERQGNDQNRRKHLKCTWQRQRCRSLLRGETSFVQIQSDSGNNPAQLNKVAVRFILTMLIVRKKNKENTMWKGNGQSSLLK